MCVTFTVTLRCVSLTVSHIAQYGSYHHHHLPHILSHHIQFLMVINNECIKVEY